eukprot:1360350-Amorphochlora_amoeboformis.AAC.2
MRYPRRSSSSIRMYGWVRTSEILSLGNPVYNVYERDSSSRQDNPEGVRTFGPKSWVLEVKKTQKWNGGALPVYRPHASASWPEWQSHDPPRPIALLENHFTFTDIPGFLGYPAKSRSSTWNGVLRTPCEAKKGSNNSRFEGTWLPIMVLQA